MTQYNYGLCAIRKDNLVSVLIRFSCVEIIKVIRFGEHSFFAWKSYTK